MSLAYTVTDSRVMIKRCIRRSLRDSEAFFTALLLPIVLMLLFVYVFGGALNTGGAYVDYVVPGLIVLCAGFGAGTTAVAVATDMGNGIVDRFRSMPIKGSSILLGHIVASLARNIVATTLVIGVGLAIGWRPTASGVEWVAAFAMIVLFALALSWLAAAVGLLARSAEAANSFTIVLMFIPYISTAFVPAHTMPSGAARLRRAPAVHADRGDDARTVDGTHVDRRHRRPCGVDCGRLLLGDPRRVKRRRSMAVPTQDGELSVALVPRDAPARFVAVSARRPVARLRRRAGASLRACGAGSRPG